MQAEETFREAKFARDNRDLSPTDIIALIPNECHVMSGSGGEAMCLQIEKSPEEPADKASAIARIIQGHMTVGNHTEWMIMPFA